MGTNVVNPLELIRRARLYNPGGIVSTPQPDFNSPPSPILHQPNPNRIMDPSLITPALQEGNRQIQQTEQLPKPQMTVQPPVQDPKGTGSPNELPFTLQNTLDASSDRPQPISPRDQALADYRQFRQQHPEPTQAGYHPSITRTILGTLLGAGVGLTNPQAGDQLAHQIAYGPFDKSISDYQKQLASKKEAFETEEKASQEEAKLGEMTEQKKAEVARAGAEEARRKAEEFKVSPEGLKQAIDLKKAGKAEPKPPGLFKVTLNNGKTVQARENADGQLIDVNSNTPLDPKSYDVNKVSPMNKTASTEKPPREGEAGAIDKWTSEHGREPTYAEQQQIHKEYEQSGRKEVDSTAADFSKEMRMGTARQSANKPYQAQFSEASKHLDNINTTRAMIASATPEAIALSIPAVLRDIVSGQGSGFRMTQAEINQIIQARGWGDSIEAFISKISGHGALSSGQRSQLIGIMDDVKNKIIKKQKGLSTVMDEIDSAEDPKGISQAHIKYRKSVTEPDEAPKGGEKGEKAKPLTPDELRKKYGY